MQIVILWAFSFVSFVRVMIGLPTNLPSAQMQREEGQEEGWGSGGRRQRQQCSEGSLPSAFSVSLSSDFSSLWQLRAPAWATFLGCLHPRTPGCSPVTALPALILSRPRLQRAWLSTNSFKEINRINSSEEFHK